jgi:hypothetical protein
MPDEAAFEHQIFTLCLPGVLIALVVVAALYVKGRNQRLSRKE